MQVKNVIIVNDFNYIQGGASKVAIDTANLLVQNCENINTYFFSAVQNDTSNLDKRVINICTNQGEALKDKNKLRGIINGIYNFKAKKEFGKLLETLDVNNTVIHVHGWTKALSSSIFDVAFKKKFKVVLTLHDYFTACPNGGYFDYKENKICKRKPLSWKCIKCNCDSRNYGFKLYRILRQFVQNKIVKLNDKLTNVISISEFSERILKETLNPKTNIQRIYNPIQFDEKDEKIDLSKNQYYLYVGRISKEKGVDVFCKVITDLKLQGIAVGDGSEKNRLEREYPNIEFTGWKSDKEVREYMKRAKVLIFPSLWYETAGLTILEAKNLGIPTLVKNTTAGSEFVSSQWIYNDENMLKSKILNIDDLYNDINQDMSKFSFEKYINDLKKYYERS